jgi:hypothetical protein
VGILDVFFHFLGELAGFLRFDLEAGYLALGFIELVSSRPMVSCSVSMCSY